MKPLPYLMPAGKFNGIMIVGGVVSKAEVSNDRLFANSEGDYLEALLKAQGVNPSECIRARVFTTLPKEKDVANFFSKIQQVDPTVHYEEKIVTPFKGMYLKPKYFKRITKIRKTIKKHKPRAIIALGDIAAWATANVYNKSFEDTVEVSPFSFASMTTQHFYKVFIGYALKDWTDIKNPQYKHNATIIKEAVNLSKKKVTVEILTE